MKADDFMGRELIVAIDPGKTTGVAVRHIGGDPRHLVQLFSLDFWSTFFQLDGLANRGRVALLVLEDNRKYGINLQRKSSISRKEVAKLTKISRDVGRVDRDVVLWEDWAARHRIPVRLMAPIKGDKWTHEQFLREIPNSDVFKVTNPHKRDAARLVCDIDRGHVRVAYADMRSQDK